jgi:hypothetical protein
VLFSIYMLVLQEFCWRLLTLPGRHLLWRLSTRCSRATRVYRSWLLIWVASSISRCAPIPSACHCCMRS